jgi:hypothetical protein
LRTTERRFWIASGIVIVLQVSAMACRDDGTDQNGGDAGADASCLPPLPPCSMPAYEPPTFSAIYDNVLRKSCGSAATGTVCHAEAGAKLGLVLGGSETRAYDHLVHGSGGRPARVTPGDPECSELVRRVESDDPAFRMPVGADKLSDGQRCAIRLWIERGAEP